MRKRLFPVLGVAALSAALVVGQEKQRPGVPGQTTPPGQPGQPGQPGRDKVGQPGMAVAIDGNWTVVSATRDGRAVDGIDKMTVTIKDNTVTFTSGVGGAADMTMRALRLDFGQNGTLRVSEADADGKFAAPGRPGDRPPGGDRPPDRRPGGDPPAAAPPGGAGQPGQPGQPAQPGRVADRAGPMTGVYVLTSDYLAVSVFDAPGSPGGIRPPGGDRPPDRRPGDRSPVGDPPVGAGLPGGATQPATGAGQPGTAPGGGIGAATGPQARSHVSVILKRTGGPGRP
jgi:hypothetical protein